MADVQLFSSIDETNVGLIDANLGGKVFRKRISKLGQMTCSPDQSDEVICLDWYTDGRPPVIQFKAK